MCERGASALQAFQDEVKWKRRGAPIGHPLRANWSKLPSEFFTCKVALPHSRLSVTQKCPSQPWS